MKIAMWYKNSRLLQIGLLIGLTLITYAASLWYGFYWDDLPSILNNYDLKNFTIKSIFNSNHRWVPSLLNSLTLKWFGATPFYFRFTNLAIHCVNGLLLYVIYHNALSQQPDSSWWHKNASLFSFVTTALFLLHPVQTQTVTYITQMRLEGIVLLVILLIMYALTAFAHATTPNQHLGYALLVGLLAIIASGTKEIIIVMPILVAAFDWFFIAHGKFSHFRQRILFHCIIAGGLWFTFFGLSPDNIFSPSKVLSLAVELPSNRGNILTEDPHQKITSLVYLFSQSKVILHYIAIFFMPFGLSFDYDYKLSSTPFTFDIMASILVIMLIIGYAFMRFIRKQDDLFTFAAGWFFVAILPRASIVPSTELVCDYKTYLASPAIMACIAYGFLKLYEKLEPVLIPLWQWQITLRHASGGLLLIILTSSTYLRNTVWSSPIAFWADVTSKAPKKARAYNNYAVALIEAGRHEEALAAYHNAIAYDAHYAEPVINLAMYYQMKNEDEKAFELYQKAIAINEPHVVMYNNLGMLHAKRNNHEKAIMCFTIATQMEPHYSPSYLNLALAHIQLKEPEKAFTAIEKSLHGIQELPMALKIHADLAQQLGKPDIALCSLEKVVKFDASGETLSRMGSCYYAMNNFAQATEYFEKAHKLNPNDMNLCYNYGQTLLRRGKAAQALPLFERCPVNQFPYAQLHAAHCLGQLARTEEAHTTLHKIISEGPAQLHAEARNLAQQFKITI